MTRRWVKYGVGGVITVAVAVGIGWFVVGRGQAHSAGRAQGEANKARTKVEVVHPRTGGVERTVRRPGSVEPFNYADLYAQVSGYLTRQVVDIGDVVKKGEVLAEISAPEVVAAVQQAKADLTKANAQVGVMQARVEGAAADLEQAHTKVEQAQVDVKKFVAMVSLRKAQYRRIKILADKDVIQQELVDERREARQAAEAAEASSRKAVITAQGAVKAAEAALKQANADLADARAKVKVAEAALERAEARASFMKIISPYDGVVTRRTYDLGDFIRDAASGGETPLLRVARTDLFRVVVYVPDPDVPYVHKGRPAVLRIDALPHEQFPGKVARTANAEDTATRTMRTEVDLPNKKGLLRAGMYGWMTIDLGATSTGLSVPSSCLVGDEAKGKRTVFVVRDGKAQRVTVAVGLDDGIHAEILSGLKADDAVVVRHGPGLENGVPVEVVQAPDKK